MSELSLHREFTDSLITLQLILLSCMVGGRVYVCTFLSIAGVRLF